MYVLLASVWKHLARIQWNFQHCAELRPRWPERGGVMMAPASAPSALTVSVCLKPLGPVTDTNKVPITGGSSSGWFRSKVTQTETNKVTMKVSCFARYGSSVMGYLHLKGVLGCKQLIITASASPMVVTGRCVGLSSEPISGLSIL